MKAVQFILVPLMVGILVMYFKRFQSKVFDRLIVLTLGSGCVLLVLFPDMTQWLANRLGVGRGVDLVVYFVLLGLTFVNFLQFSKLRSLEASMTQLARQHAIQGAQNPEESDS